MVLTRQHEIEVAKWIASESAVYATYMGVGDDTTAATTSDTALGNEITRVAVTSSTEENVAKFVAEFLSTNAAAGSTCQEIGTFSASSSGTMLEREVFPNSFDLSDSQDTQIISFEAVTGENTPASQGFICDDGMIEVVEFITAGTGTAPTHIGYSPYLILEQCDAVGTWTDDSSDASTPTQNTTNYQEGTGSLNGGKDGATSTSFKYNNPLASAIDASSATQLRFYFNILNSASLNTFASSTAVTFKVGSDSSNYISDTLDRADLQVGWKRYDFTVSAMSTTGSPDLANADFIEVLMATTNSSDTITHGDLLFDFFHAYWALDPTVTILHDEQYREALTEEVRNIGESIVTFNTTVAVGSGNTYTYNQIGLFNASSNGDLFFAQETAQLRKDSLRTIDSSIQLTVAQI